MSSQARDGALLRGSGIKCVSCEHCGAEALSTSAACFVNLRCSKLLVFRIQQAWHCAVARCSILFLLFSAMLVWVSSCLDTIFAETEVLKRKTKVICTLGPACWSVETLGLLIDADCGCCLYGASSLQRFLCVSLNESAHVHSASFVQNAALSTRRDKHVAIMLAVVARQHDSHTPMHYCTSRLHSESAVFDSAAAAAAASDTKGPEIRTGFLEDGKAIQLTRGQRSRHNCCFWRLSKMAAAELLHTYCLTHACLVKHM
eukprot:8935-Heterococcus_DN1.PRE.3